MSNNKKQEKIFSFLEKLDIPYEVHQHPPVHTVEEAETYWKEIEGAHTKNLFLRDNKGKRHFLVVMEKNQAADLGAISGKLGAGKLSFASDNRLAKYLNLEKGAVSPFGLINDEENQVEVVLDKKLKNKKQINFHPNVNTATLTITYQDFERFLETCGNKVLYI